MDPLTHTLFGAALSATALGRKTSLATLTLVLGANLPDVDILTYVGGSDFALAHRRSWTHGILAVAILPLLLSALILTYDHWRRRWGRGPAASPTWIVVLSYVSVLSHPCLDWLNTYGVRLLMPFDSRWFYGDALFIVDPWMWLLLGSPLFLIHSRSRRAVVNWAALAVVTSVPVLAVTPPQWFIAHGVWSGSLLLLLALRWGRIVPHTAQGSERLATLLLAVVVLYVLSMVASSRLARAQAAAHLELQGAQPIGRIMAGPLPVNPLVREVVAETRNHYHYATFDWHQDPKLRPGMQTLPRPPKSPIVEAALGAPGVRGMVRWARFPFVEVDELDRFYAVHVLDARYTRTRTRGFGGATVWLDRTLKPIDSVVGTVRENVP